MEQVAVCNSWEEFDDNSKLLEEQLEKLKLDKGRQHQPLQLELEEQSGPSPLSVPSKMRVLKRTTLPNNNEEVGVGRGVAATSTNEVIDVGQEESMRTQYTPPEPKISILSRPKKKSSGEQTASSKSANVKTQQVKTLEQREQEYAEARRRIFGVDTLET